MLQQTWNAAAIHPQAVALWCGNVLAFSLFAVQLCLVNIPFAVL
jgi:hypothetical protein